MFQIPPSKKKSRDTKHISLKEIFTNT